MSLKKQVFDQILENKIGFGQYQIKTLIILGLIDLNDGMQLGLMSLIMPVLKNRWKLSLDQVEFLSSLFYFGMFFGSILAGKLADQVLGRKKTITLSTLMIILVTLQFAVLDSYHYFKWIRFFYGFSFGLSLPLTTSMIAEISILQYRGKLLVIVNFLLSIGKIISIILAYLFLEADLKSGNYQMMMLVSSLPMFFVLIFNQYYIEESPRYLLANQKTDEAIESIKQMCIKNNRNVDLTEEEVKDLQHYHLTLMETTSGFNNLFKKQNLRLTVMLWLIWVSINFMYHGQLTILPFVIIQQKSLSTMFYAVLGELPSIFFSLFLIDNPAFGRRKSITFFYFVSIFSNIVTAFYPNGLMFFISRFTMKNIFSVLYPYTTEAYDTLNRTIGYGSACAVGRLGSIFMPYVLFPLLNLNIKYPFLFLAFTSLVGTFAAYFLPYDTSQKYLDTDFNDNQNNEQFINIPLIQQKLIINQ